jgi:hypothetical protein
MQAIFTINKTGYTFTNNAVNVVLNTVVKEIKNLTAADGSNTTTTTTQLTLTLDSSLSTLTKEDITITDITTPDRIVNISAITGTNPYTLNINGT